MAPKRGAGVVGGPKTKVQKQVDNQFSKYGCSKANYEAVIDGIRRGVHLNVDCRDMLIAMVPSTLCVPADQRGELQAKCVSMIDETFSAVAEQLKVAMDDETAKVAAVEASKSELESKVVEAEAMHTAASELAEAKTAAHVKASQKRASLSEVLASKKAEQEQGNASLMRARKEKEPVTNMLASEFKSLLDGTWDTQEQAETHIRAVSALARNLGIEESMLAALPAALGRKPAERGAFDIMLVQECNQKFQNKVAEIDLELKNGAPAEAERAAAVAAAETALQEGMSAEGTTANELLSAKTAVKDAKATVKEAENVVAKFEGTHRTAVASLQEKKTALENFTDYNVACFKILRDAVAKKDSVGNLAEVNHAEGGA